jgi:putative SOS response-associated peptidase YedK
MNVIRAELNFDTVPLVEGDTDGRASANTREEPVDEAQLKALLAPYPSDGMVCWPVSARVGNVKNNDPSLIEPIVLP